MKVLLLITKQFPYGNKEAYLEHELPFLEEQFDRIYFLPADYFGPDSLSRHLSEKCEVLHYSQNLRSGKGRHFTEFVRMFMKEFRLSKDRMFLFRKLKKHISVLRHQQALADMVTPVIKKHKEQGDKVYTYAYWIHYGAVMASLLLQRGIIDQFVVRGHSIDLYHKDWVLAKEFGTAPLCFHFITLDAAGLIAPVSDHGTNYLKGKFPRYSNKIRTHRLGVPSGTPLFGSRGERAFEIVSCSFLTRNKRVERIPGILALLDFPVRWVHFGGGHTDKMEELKQLIDKLPANIQVDLKGTVSNQDILNYYENNRVDLIINLSMAEGLPVSLMEAISFGIPVLATDVNGTPEIANEHTGYSVPSDFKDQLIAKCIQQLFEDPVVYDNLRKSAYDWYQEYFSSAKNYRLFVNAIGEHPA